MKTKFILLACAAISLSHCADDLKKKIEDARFLLDKGEYSQVVTLLTPVVAEHPESLEARFLLASSQVAFVVVGDKESYLSIFAEFLKDKDAGKSAFQTFARLSPSSNQLSLLQDARDQLLTLSTEPALTDPSDKRKVFLQLYLTRLFEIGGIVKEIGAASPDVLCNANHANPKHDGIPDDFDPNAASAGDLTRLTDDLAVINTDGAGAGFPGDFALNSRMDDIATDLTNAGDALTFLKNSFGDTGGGEVLCTL